MRLSKTTMSAALAAVLMLGANSAFAAQPVDGAIGMQPAATGIMESVTEFHNILLWIITLITLFVTALLVYTMVRHNANANPVPKKFSHNTTIEVIWTAVPTLILIFIAVLSFPLLFLQENFPDVPEDQVVNVKAQGNQWNWTYYYQDVVDPDGFPLEFVSNPLHRGLSTDQRAYEEGTMAVTGGDLWDNRPVNLAVDYPMVVPVDTVIRVYTAASDVIHSWTVPAFGVKTDAVPGRLNELWFKVDEVGTYYGQCSELCGKDHAFMPIEVRVVTREQYDQWVASAQDDLDQATQLLASFSQNQPTQLALVDR